MAKQERAVYNNWDSSTEFWEYRHNQAESQSERTPLQTGRNTDYTETLFWIIGTIGFLALIAMKMLWRS